MNGRDRVVITLSLFVGLLALVGCDTGTSGNTPDARPNIVLLLIDDMGINDIGINGSDAVSTPHIDQLAAEGVYFSRHYTDSTCAATRAGIMTGQSPASAGFRPQHRGISPEVITLPEALREAGYSTHHIGKWHLGHSTPLAWPTAQGFDTFEGFLHQWQLGGPVEPGELSLTPPTYRDPWLQKQDAPTQRYEGHLSQILQDLAVEFIATRPTSGKPWFLNLWLYAPHSPLEAQQSYAAKYPDTPRGRYLAMVEQADATVGAVMAALKRHGQEDNTLVLVASDNGGAGRHFDSNAPLHGNKATYLEGGVRAPLLARWPGRLPAGEVVDEVVSYLDFYPTLLAAAGEAGAPGRIGQSLFQVIENGRSNPAALAWEFVAVDKQTWSVLSADGRWRLFQFYVGELQLFDLQADPAGRDDVAAQYPHVVAAMHNQYVEWRNQQRVLALDYQQEDDSGRGTLTGLSLQRSPGYGGFGFSVALYPRSAKSADSVQVIALQEGQWQLTYVTGRFVLKLDGKTLRTQDIALDACTHVIVTSHHSYSARFRNRNRAIIKLYVNGRLAAQAIIPDAQPGTGQFMAPTFIGQDSRGGRRFAGRLVAPRIYNDYLAVEHNGILESGVEMLAKNACTGSQHGNTGKE